VLEVPKAPHRQDQNVVSSGGGDKDIDHQKDPALCVEAAADSRGKPGDCA
jgi:hypothetical protein